MKTLVLAGLLLLSFPGLGQDKADSTAILQVLIRDYATLENFDFDAHLANLSSPYYLIENGELWDVSREKAYYTANAHRKLKRENYFDVETVKIYGNMAYAIYTLQSDILENGAFKGRRWIETAIFRKGNDGWKLEVLHSTRTELKK